MLRKLIILTLGAGLVVSGIGLALGGADSVSAVPLQESSSGSGGGGLTVGGLACHVAGKRAVVVPLPSEGAVRAHTAHGDQNASPAASPGDDCSRSSSGGSH